MIFAYKNQETDTLEKSFGKKGRRGSGKKARVFSKYVNYPLLEFCPFKSTNPVQVGLI